MLTASVSWWSVSRSTGIVATVLAAVALVWGLLFSARATGQRLPPAWWLALHNWLGGLTLTFTTAHVVAVFLDHDSGIGLKAIAIPTQALDLKTPITWGVLSTYGFIVVVATSWPKLRFPRRVWRAVHLLSLPAFVMACVHGYEVGSDGSTTAFKVLLVALTALVAFPVGLRLMGVRAKRVAATRK